MAVRDGSVEAMSLVSATLVLLLVMDPVGNLPVFVATLSDVAPERRRRVLLRELLAAYLVLLAFLLAGHHVLGLLHLSPAALGIAGGVILFLASLRMVFPAQQAGTAAPWGGEPFLVPLAVPLIAGPAAMTMLLILASRYPSQRLRWVLALSLAWVGVSAILMLSGLIQRLLGDRGVRALTRLMGMILIVLAVQMLLDGLRAFLATVGIAPPATQPALAGG